MIELLDGKQVTCFIASSAISGGGSALIAQKSEDPSMLASPFLSIFILPNPVKLSANYFF